MWSVLKTLLIGDIFMGIAGQMFSSWICAILNVHVYGFTVYIADVIGACIIIWIGNKLLTK